MPAYRLRAGRANGRQCRKPGGGIAALPDSFMAFHRAAIISLAIGNKVPAVGFLPPPK